jgi:hypothetical protein
MMDDNEVLTAALDYAARGWRVLPLHSVDHLGECTCASPTCGSVAKHPLLRDGVKGASADPDVVRSWWARWPWANVGIATGESSGLWVLDLDRAKSGEVAGADALALAEAAAAGEGQPGVPDGPRAVTGSGGEHLLLAWPDDGLGVQSRARVLPKRDGRPAAADTRGSGGYIVAPPSLHRTGAVYRWETAPGPEGLPQAPAWLLELVRAAQGAPKVEALPAGDWEKRIAQRAAERATTAHGASAEGRVRAYVESALTRACGRVAATPKGGRHDGLLREARTLGGWLHLGLDAGQVAGGLLEAALAAGMAEGEARRTIEAGLEHGAQSPRDVPESIRRVVEQGPRADPDAAVVWDEVEEWCADSEDDEVFEEPDPLDVVGDVVEGTARPRIILTGRQPREIAEDARRALAGIRGAGRLYLRDGRIVQVVVSEHGPAIREVGGDEVQSLLVGGCDWLDLRRPKKHEITAGEEFLEEPAKALPGYVVAAVRGHRGAWLPGLSRVATAPFFARDAGGDARLVHGDGYDAQSEGFSAGSFWVRRMGPGEGLALVDELIADFPFESPGDRAHALAFALSPIVRDLVRGPVPMTVFEAPSPGTGKSLLMQVLATAATGRAVEPTPMSSQEDERRKAMGSMLQEGRPVVLLDNVRGHLHDPALEGVLTAYPTWSDRRMGGQDRLRVPALAVWGLSGNNLTMNADLARRTVSVRLNARTAQPELRRGFRHADLLGWVAERREDLTSALVAMVEAWMQAGQPQGGQVLGSYESWSRVVGGILQTAGVEGFLAERESRALSADPEAAEWSGLLHLWLSEPALKGQRSAAELARWCADRGLLLGVLGDKGERSQATRLGSALRGMRGRVWRVGEVDVEITSGGALKGCPSWRVRPVGSGGGQALPFPGSREG